MRTWNGIWNPPYPPAWRCVLRNPLFSAINGMRPPRTGRYAPVNPNYDRAPKSQQHNRSQALQNKSPAWLSVFLTIILLLSTLLQYSKLPIKSRMYVLYSLSSMNLFILSIVSGFTDVFLAASMTASIENDKGTLISLNNGLRISRFLALQPSTRLVGLLQWAMGSHCPWASTTWIWFWIRIINLVLIPGLESWL